LIPPESSSSSSDLLALPSLPLPIVVPIIVVPRQSLCSSSGYYPALKHSGYPVSGVSHQPLSGVDPPRAFREPAPPGLVDPMAPPPVSEPVTPPWPVVLTPPPSLLPPSAPAGTIECSARLGSFGTSALPGSNIAITKSQTCGSSTALCPSTPSALFGSAFPQTQPMPSVAPVPS
jgi:hypothetical protein